MSIYLAINYETNMWHLKPYRFAKDAVQDIKDGKACGHKWKILKELEFEIDEKGSNVCQKNQHT